MPLPQPFFAMQLVNRTPLFDRAVVNPKARRYRSATEKALLSISDHPKLECQ